MPGGTNRIPLGEYEHLCTIDVAYEGFVEGENGELFYVYCEAAVIGYYENKWHMSYSTSTQSHEILIHPTDNTRIDATRMELNADSKLASGRIRSKVRKLLTDSLISYFQEYYGTRNDQEESVFGPREIKVDVPADKRKAHYQDKFGKLKDKIENGTIRRSDLDERIQFALKSEIDIYFACFDPNDPKHKAFWHKEKEEVGFWESLIPVWGSLKSSEYHFSQGNHWRGAGFVVLAISDVALVKSIATGIAKGAWKTGPHAWKPTRQWLGERGYLAKGEQGHHAFIHNATGKKYNIEWFVNQPWNIKGIKTYSEHIRFGHGRKFKELPAGTIIQQFRYGIPGWPKALGGSYGGRGVIEIIEE